MTEKKINYKAVYIIVNAGFGEETTRIVREQGAGGATIVNARGTGGKYKSFLGIPIEPEKEIIISVAPEEIANKIVEAVSSKIGPATDFNGICYYMPVDKVSFINRQIVDGERQTESETPVTEVKDDKHTS